MFAENIKQGLGSVKAHATRAVITSSIIAIGIAALVGILTSISAMQIAVTKTFSKMGSQSFTIKNAGGVKRYGEVDDNTRLTFDEAWAFQSRMEGKQSTVALSINADFTGKASFQSAETNPNLRVIGIDEDYLKTANYELGAGRTFTDNEEIGRAHV